MCILFLDPLECENGQLGSFLSNITELEKVVYSVSKIQEDYQNILDANVHKDTEMENKINLLNETLNNTAFQQGQMIQSLRIENDKLNIELGALQQNHTLLSRRLSVLENLLESASSSPLPTGNMSSGKLPFYFFN